MRVVKSATVVALLLAVASVLASARITGEQDGFGAGGGMAIVTSTCNTTGQTAQSLEGARDLARAINKTACAEVTITLSGAFERSETLKLAAEDSSVTWTATSSNPAFIVGGSYLHPSGWNVVSAAERNMKGLPTPLDGASVYAYYLGDVNLTSVGYGKYFSGGLGQCHQSRAELNVLGIPMTVARYPNAPVMPGEPWMNWSHVADVGKGAGASAAHEVVALCPRGASAADLRHWSLERGGRNCRVQEEGDDDASSTDLPAHSFSVSDMPRDVAERIAALPAAELTKGWAHGFWAFDWADNYIELANATLGGPKGANLTLAYNPKTPPVYRMVPKARFYVTNLKTELDQPGEYWFDETANFVYFVAEAGSPIDPQTASSMITTVSGGVIQIENAHDITFRGIQVQGSRSSGIEVSNGLNIVLDGMTVSSTGLAAVALSGSNSTVTGLTSKYAGCHAVSLSGGNEATLEASGLVVQDSLLSRYARWTRTYNPGVSFGGVGHKVLRNTIGNAPHNGLQGGGNNHLFEGNALSNLCWEVRDSGSFYVGRSWTHRGMVLRFNTFTNIVALEPTFLGSDSVQAMYLDDQQSGVTIVDNGCDNVHVCLLVGGGRDNTIANNSCGAFQRACIAFDDRGLNWQRAMCTGEGLLVQQLHAAHYQSPPYSIEYPRIVDTMSDRPCTPVGNAFTDNRCCGCNATFPFMDVSDATVHAWGSNISGTIYDC